jgi:hypothetical protein
MDSIVHFPSENVVIHFLKLLPSERPSATTTTTKSRPAALPLSHFFSNSESFACKMT